MVNKGQEKILAKIHHPYIIFLDFIVKRDHPVVFVKGDIEQPLQDSGFAHFAPGQHGGTLGFSFLDIVNPLFFDFYIQQRPLFSSNNGHRF
jgi:hypothetical protein